MQHAENQEQGGMKKSIKTEKDTNNIAPSEKLVMVDLVDGDGEAWLARWQRAKQPWQPRVLTTLAEARVALGEWESSHLLVCYRSPFKQLEIALAKDTPPAQAVVDWKESTEALLNLYRRHWKRITLVEQEAVTRKERELLKHLEQRTGLTLAVPEHELQAKDRSEHNEPTASPMYELIALQLLNMRKSRPLFQELEASSLPLSERPDIMQLVESAINSGKSQAQLVIKEELQQENDLIIEQLHKTQEELEQYYLKLKKTESDIKIKNQKLHDFSQRNKQLKAQLDAAKTDLKRIRNSRSWKITAPLRKKTKGQ